MGNDLKRDFLATLSEKFGGVRSLPQTQSLYDLGDNLGRVYVRYSKVHSRHRTFFGLRKVDLQQLEGHRSFICFLWDRQKEPLILPFADYEDVFHETTPAGDGQFKVQVFLRDDSTELYIARAGRFNVDAHLGWTAIEKAVRPAQTGLPPLAHSQIQTLLGAIGAARTFDIWIPPKDREALDWSMSDRFRCLERLPSAYERVDSILQEIDVVWVQRGSSTLAALYEVEHSTPIYSGLLRFNDVHLLFPPVDRFAIVSNEPRRSLFVKQLKRPTFQRSGLSDICSFLEYSDVYEWHKRIQSHR